MNEVTIGNMPTLPYAVEEAVNRLRINISFLGSDIKKIMVISTMPVATDWNLMSGDFLNVKITGADEYDLIGEVIEE